MSKRPILLVIIPALCTADLAGQNLVPNPSFEDVTPCPSNWNDIDNATGWTSFRASPDLYNACGFGGFGVPNNNFGTRNAADGLGYAGMYCYYGALTNRREYIGAPLTQPLQPGLATQVSFKVAAAGGGGEQFIMQWWCSHIGVKFSMTQWYEQKNTETVSNEADVFYDQVVTYSADWLTVSGTFIPDSAYAYIVVGNFFADDLIDVLPTGWPGASTPGGYYYVDDFCVSQGAGANCDMANATTDVSKPMLANVHFDPSDRTIRVSTPAEHSEVTLIDGSGRMMLARSIGRSASLPADDLPSGIYLIKLVGEGSVSSFTVLVP